jgi:PqqD family protein of HPr-rel-A system
MCDTPNDASWIDGPGSRAIGSTPSPAAMAPAREAVGKIPRAVEGIRCMRDEDSVVGSHIAGDGTALILTVAGDYVPRRRDDVLEIDMGDGVVLYDPAGRLVHHLNPSASVAWQLFDGAVSVRQLAGEISDELRLEPTQVRDQIEALVAELDALGLVEDARRSTMEGALDA